MAESLLASLYTRIKGSQEDVATLSLQYILSESEILNSAFNRLLSDSLRLCIGDDIRYSCQSVGKDKERPDMSGVDREGNEIILCEMKFYAGLTENQPNGYLDRLIDNGGKALVFVCPEARKISLWSKLLELCKGSGRTISEEDDCRVKVDGIVMSLVTWNRIVDELRRVSSHEALSSKPDVEQLAGFCSMMDNIAFVPFTSEELGSIVAKKEERNYQVIDTLYEKILADKTLKASGKGFKATAWRGGYTRYISINGYNVALMYNRNAWMKASLEDTPFWFYYCDEDWQQSAELKSKLRGIPESEKTLVDNKVSLALTPLLHATLDEVAEDLMSKILRTLVF